MKVISINERLSREGQMIEGNEEKEVCMARLVLIGTQVPARTRAFLQQIAVPEVPFSATDIPKLVGSMVSNTAPHYEDTWNEKG